MSKDVAERILRHYGVRGMRWGVRRSAGERSAARTAFKKAPSKLSAEELAKRIGRMEMEKKYNTLNAPDKSKGRDAAEEVLSSAGKNIAKTVLTGAGLLAIKTAISLKFGPDTGSAVTRRLK